MIITTRRPHLGPHLGPHLDNTTDSVCTGLYSGPGEEETIQHHLTTTTIMDTKPKRGIKNTFMTMPIMIKIKMKITTRTMTKILKKNTCHRCRKVPSRTSFAHPSARHPS